jgi:dephospho-CoA kinase
MLKIGITGGIGTGKTTVCAIFQTLGIPIYNADQKAKALMHSDKTLREAIKYTFGAATYTNENQLNTTYLADIVFNDTNKLALLNALVHPAVQHDSDAWHDAQQNVPYTLKEAALLYESGGYRTLDKVIVVTAPMELRINRVLNRDKVNRAAVEARMSKQWTEEEKIKRADFVIYNDGEQLLLPQVLAIHQILKQV